METVRRTRRAGDRASGSDAGARPAKVWTREEPSISEEDGLRYLHLGTPWIQGAMKVSEPSALVLEYTRQMMVWLLFLAPSPRDEIGVLGLGAGSLLRYTLKHTPSRVTTVEWNPRVTAACQAYFRLPRNSRSTIVHDDALSWLTEPAQAGRYAALMVDLYDSEAQGPVHGSVAFYRRCRRALGDAGVVTVNLFGNHDSFLENLANLRDAFGNRVLLLPEIDEGNRIAVALHGPVLDVSVSEFLARAGDVEAQYGLPAQRWAKALLAQCGAAGRVHC